MLILSNLAQRFKLPPVQLGKLGGLGDFLVAPGSCDLMYANYCMRLLLINAPHGFVREMSRRDHDLLIADGEVSHIEAELKHPRCEFLQFRGSKKIDSAAIRLLRQTVHRFKPDLIHAFLPASLAQSVIGCIGLKPRPIIMSFRGITRVPSPFDPADWITYLSPRIAIHACESEAVKQAMTRGRVPNEKCEVIYNCVVPALSLEKRADLRQRFDIPADAFVVGTAACIRPVKGIDILMRAAAECAALPKIHFLVFGEQKDPHVAELARDNRLRNRVILTGHLNDAQRLMPIFDVFVMPSRREGLCRALLEAMDQSICPLVSDAGGMKEMVRHGVDGLVFPSEDFSALRDSIIQLHGDRNSIASYGASAQARVRQICSPENFANRLEAIYERLHRETIPLFRG
jgi:glycosyltransferase involved in cell wall biosynthesis